MDSNNQNMCGGGCRCGHHYVAPVAVILIGVTVLLQTFSVITPMVANTVWPILLIVAACTKLCKCCK